MTNYDKLIERARYEGVYSGLIGNETVAGLTLGSQSMPAYLRTPYIFYEHKIAELVQSHQSVLELGSGSGLHTLTLLQTGAQVTASDISSNSVCLLREKFKNYAGNFKTCEADMERLPFDDASFDVIACAGSLSYGAPILVDAEIRRVLRPGGMLISVDSLNHNPIYRLNRWLRYIRGNRTKSTLKRMPDLPRIRALSEGFSSVNVHFFGAMSYAMPGIARLLGENTALVVSDRNDHLVGVRRSAFKFVVVAQGFA